MQLPNITLVLQLFHFYIAYAILRHFVFQPILQIIIAQNLYEKKLQNNIQTWQSEYESIVAKAHAKWISTQQYLIKMIPSMKKQLPVISKHTLVLSDHQLSEQQKQKMSDMIQKSLSDVV